jgi:tetratricopeptide (TPR) repeat protein
MRFAFIRPYILLLIFLALILGSSPGQDLGKIDSLTKGLSGLGGMERFETLKQLFNLYSSYDYNKMYEVSEDALKTALQVSDSLLIIKAYRMKGFSLAQLTDNVRAISVFNSALETVKRNSSDPKIKEQEKYILNSIALSYLELGNFSKALEYNYLSLAIRQKEGNKEEQSISLNNLGLVYYRLNDYRKAIEYYSECVFLRDRLGLNEDYDKLILVNLALCYIGLEDFEKALVYGNNVLVLCRSGCSSEVEREATYVIGLAHLKSNALEKAKLYFNKSLEIAKKQKDISSMVINMINLSKVDLANGNNQKAIRRLHQAEEVIEGVEHPIVTLKVYQALAETNQIVKNKKNANDYKNATDYLLKYIELKDSVYSNELILNLAKVQKKLAENENIKADKAKDKTLGSSLQVINQQRRQFILVVVITLFSLVFSLLLFRAIRKQRQKIAIIQKTRNKH